MKKRRCFSGEEPRSVPSELTAKSDLNDGRERDQIEADDKELNNGAGHEQTGAEGGKAA